MIRIMTPFTVELVLFRHFVPILGWDRSKILKKNRSICKRGHNLGHNSNCLNYDPSYDPFTHRLVLFQHFSPIPSKNRTKVLKRNQFVCKRDHNSGHISNSLYYGTNYDPFYIRIGPFSVFWSDPIQGSDQTAEEEPIRL